MKTTKIVTYPFFTAVYVPARFASASPTNTEQIEECPTVEAGDWPVTRGPLKISIAPSASVTDIILKYHLDITAVLVLFQGAKLAMGPMTRSCIEGGKTSRIAEVVPARALRA